MTPKKYQKILAEMFENKQSVMAKKLEVSSSKISHLMTGRQNLPADKIGLLLTKYNLQPEWFFNASDDEPLRLKSEDENNSQLKQKYYEALEENVSLLREKAEWYKERDSKKNHSNLPDEQ